MVEKDALSLHTIRLCGTDRIGFRMSLAISGLFRWHNASVQLDNKLNTVCGSLHGPVAMRRRKLMIGLGALTAGGSAAFGTEAFTSVEAQRNVDVTVAGDDSSYLVLDRVDSENGNEYTAYEGDSTLKIILDGEGQDGGGVVQDAITKIEDLFRIVNQGSQPTNVYFEDDSDAVTFRVTQSVDTSTTGSKGQSLEEADNSVKLDVGEEIVVGMTIDTKTNDVDTNQTILDSVTLYAESGTSAPDTSAPTPQYVVDPDGDTEAGNVYDDIPSAISAASAQSVIGVAGDATLEPSDPVSIEKPVTITGINGKPSIDATGNRQGFAVKTDGVTIRNLAVDSAGSNISDNETEVGGIFVGNKLGFTDAGTITIENVDITNVDGTGTERSAEGIHIKSYNKSDAIDSVNIKNVTIDNVDANTADSYDDGGRGANGIKLQADVEDISISDTEIRNIAGHWGYGVVLTPSRNEDGTPKDISFDTVSIDDVDAEGSENSGVGVGVDAAGGDPTDTGVADPDELSFSNTTIQDSDVGIINKNTNKDLDEPEGVDFISVDTNVSNPESNSEG